MDIEYLKSSFEKQAALPSWTEFNGCLLINNINNLAILPHP